MEHKIIFREMLSEIKTAADAAGDVITKGEIREILRDLPLEEEHFQLIYDYLAEQRIRVVDSREELQEETAGPQRSLSMYLDELEALTPEMEQDERRLLERLLEGDAEARVRVIESYLPLICEMAGEYEGTDLPAEDLIQEGNLGLLTALESLAQFESAAACRAHILNHISRAMEGAIGSSRETRQMADGIVSRVNHLHEAVQNLERDLGHKVTAEELSAYLEMPLSEIRDILRMSGDQIELDQ